MPAASVGEGTPSSEAGSANVWTLTRKIPSRANARIASRSTSRWRVVARLVGPCPSRDGPVEAAAVVGEAGGVLGVAGSIHWELMSSSVESGPSRRYPPNG
ncbi:hypothetical protein GCM10022377_20330 [Zhihengliuella alba]|uniref:Uncharacterized protein n=1 Tax=Zhihengliuella alba TaxID=547018 RepID=A0ABP7DML6_9MICC